MLPLIRRLLAPEGELWLFNQLPGWGESATALGFAAELTEVLADHGLATDDPVIADLSSGTALCIRSRPLREPMPLAGSHAANRR